MGSEMCIRDSTGIGPCHNAPGSMSECFQNASIVLVGMHPSCRMSSGATSLCSQDHCCNALGSHGRLHPEPVSWCIERLCQEAYKIDVRMHSVSMSHHAFMSDCIRMTPTSYQKASGAKPAYISSELLFQLIQTSCRKSSESMTSFIENPRRLDSDESPYPNKPAIHLRMRSEFSGKQSRCTQTANRDTCRILTSVPECIQEPC